MSERALTLEGKLVAVSGKANVSAVAVWLAYRSISGEESTVESVSDETGSFAFSLPGVPLERALVGAELEGVEPVDLEPGGDLLEPGDLVLMVDDIVPVHLRYGS
jgi:hypothetical protein